MRGNDPGEQHRRVALAALAVVSLAVLLGVRLVADGRPQASPSDGASPGDGRSGGAQPVARVLREPEDVVAKEVLAGLRFVDVTKQVGLGGRAPHRVPDPDDMDAGAAVVDLEDDGDLDLLLTSAGWASGLYRSEDGQFARVRRSGLDRLARSTVATFGDVDADGAPDLFIGGPGAKFGRLYVNVGSARFADRSVARGVVGRPDEEAPSRNIRGADFGDVDGDGDLDLLVTDWNSSAVAAAAVSSSGTASFDTQCEYSAFMRRQLERGAVPPTGDTRLLLNDGNGRFRDGTDEWGLRGLGGILAFTPQLHDLDGDGRLDLVVAGDVCTSRLLRNDGDRFVDHTPTSGAGTAENGMGSLVQDLDGDGRPDWLVTSIGYPTADGACPQVSLFAGCSGNRVFLNRGGMEFRDATDALGMRHSGWAWGVGAADFANDGRVQVVVTNGTHLGSVETRRTGQEQVFYDTFRDDRSRFWVRRGAGRFADAAGQVGLDDERIGFAVVPFDYDRDGRVDLLITHAGSSPALYRNVTRPHRHWLTLRLDDPGNPANRQALGAEVEVTGPDGRVITNWVHTSGSYQAQRPAEVHVGLGDDAGPVRVRIRWPGGGSPQVMRRLGVDRVVTVSRRD